MDEIDNTEQSAINSTVLENSANNQNNMPRRKKLSEFVKSKDRKWRRNNGNIVSYKVDEVSSVVVGPKNGQQTEIEIVEPADTRSQTLRTYNILVYSMYFPIEVRDFLIEEFPAASRKVGLDSTTESDFIDKTSTNIIQQNFGTVNTVVRRHGVKKIAEALNKIEREDACGWGDPVRYLLKTSEKVVNDNRPDKYHASTGPIVPHGEATYRTNGNPPLISIKVINVMDW